MEPEEKKWIWWAIPIVVVVALGVALYFGRRNKDVEPAPAVAQTEPAPEQPAAPPVHHPIEPDAGDKPLPSLSESDSTLNESLNGLFGPSFAAFLVPKDVVRNTVVTIDNLPRKKTAVPRWPLKATAGEFMVTGDEDVVVNEANYERYAPLVKLATSVDAKTMATTYRHFYPLFQQAYVDLGYPDGYFNNRLVEVIDHLLQTPEVTGDLRLTQPGVFYQFADPQLEELSAGQKVLLRMGRDNSLAVKTKLREFRNEIAKPAG